MSFGKAFAVLTLVSTIAFGAPTGAWATSGSLIATVGGGVASQLHVAGSGDWTFELVGITGQIRKVTVAVSLGNCHAPTSDDPRSVEISRPSVGNRFIINSIPLGRHCARARAEGQEGATAAFRVSHPNPPTPGTVTILEPATAEPVHVSSPQWPVWVSAAVFGHGEDYDSSTSQLDWYDCLQGVCTLLEADMQGGLLSLGVGTHTLVVSVSAPGAGAEDTLTVIVHPELTVTLGAVTVSGSTVYVPVSVTDEGVGLQTRLEPRVITQVEGVIMQKDSMTDAQGNATLALKVSRPGTYRIEVNAFTSDGMRYGLGTATLTK